MASPSTSMAASRPSSMSAAPKSRCGEVSNYPWSGEIAIEVDPATAKAFDVKLRIPGWCKGATAKVNGEAVTRSTAVNGYVDHPPRRGRRATWSARPADAGRAHLYAIPRVGWMSAASRSGAGRWSTASRRPTIRAARCSGCKLPRESELQVAQAATCSTASSRSRARHGDRRSRVEHALPHQPAQGGAGDAHGAAVLSVGQPRPGLDDGLDPGGYRGNVRGARRISPCGARLTCRRYSAWPPNCDSSSARS